MADDPAMMPSTIFCTVYEMNPANSNDLSETEKRQQKAWRTVRFYLKTPVVVAGLLGAVYGFFLIWPVQ